MYGKNCSETGGSVCSASPQNDYISTSAVAKPMVKAVLKQKLVKFLGKFQFPVEIFASFRLGVSGLSLSDASHPSLIIIAVQFSSVLQQRPAVCCKHLHTSISERGADPRNRPPPLPKWVSPFKKTQYEDDMK